MLYPEVLARSGKKPILQIDAQSPFQITCEVLRLSLNISTWLALGATLQVLLILLPIPRYYSLAPGVLFLLTRILLNSAIWAGLIRNPYLKDSIPYRVTAIVPDKYGNFPAEGQVPTNEKVAVLLLTSRVNHPAGWIKAPHVDKFAELFEVMNEDLRTQSQEHTGLLGYTQAYMPAGDGSVEILNFIYWRSKEDILRFAESPSHRAAINWWRDMGGYDGNGGQIPHIGIGHEIYESEPGQWESVYLHMQPTMLGATSYLKKGNGLEKSETPTEWISPLIEARRGKLAGSRGRMGLPLTKEPGFATNT